MREKIKKFLRALKSPAVGKIISSTRGHRGAIALLSVLNAVSAVLGLMFTLVMKELVDFAVAGQREKVITYAVLMAGLILIQLLMGYCRRVLSVKIRARMLETMRGEAIHRLLHKSYKGLTAYHSGELVNRVFSDVSVVADGVVSIVPPLLYLAIQLIGAAIILLRMDSAFMLILLITGALGAVLSFLMRNRMKAFHKQSQQAEDKLHARVQETFGNARIIKASALEDKMEREAAGSQKVFTAAQLKRGRFSALMGTGLGLVFRGSWFYALMWGCAGIVRGTLTYGGLTATLQLVNQIQSPFEGLISTMGTVYSTVSSAERLMELYDLPDDAAAPDGDISGFKRITAENITFSYDENKDVVLKNASFTVNAGETVAVMGPSGSGKSTLFSLLLGIYEPAEGRILVSGSQGETEGARRGLFAYVPQGNMLMSGTLKENIALFTKHPVTDAEIAAAADAACIGDFIKTLPQGMDSVIGEHGIGLSEGQAQRVAIARALLTDSPVLLLDESTSALDGETEAKLLQNIAAQNRTCIIVTHRKAALGICTRAVKIEEGKIVEEKIGQ